MHALRSIILLLVLRTVAVSSFSHRSSSCCERRSFLLTIPTAATMAPILLPSSPAYPVTEDTTIRPFHSAAYDLKEYTNSIVASRDTNISPKEVYDTISSNFLTETFKAATKKAKEGEPFWESPWGQGRPGWHIECSAMIHDIFKGEIDIHCGGNDLIFPHHENERAQSTSAFNHKFVKHWVHNGMINFSGKKMSKSEGNSKFLQEYINNYGGNVLRYFFQIGRAHV